MKKQKSIKKIAVLTSGGDAPGLNAAIRAVVRTALANDIKVMIIKNGYEGMINGDFENIDASFVSNIIHRGGTVLSTSRSERFMLPQWRKKAYEQLKKEKVDAVVLIGGNGSFAGAHTFTTEFDLPFIGVPKTIDNDVAGTDFSIGFDTATNTALEAIDKIRDTANSHHRLFFVEVMGRDFGYIALHCGIAAGAEAILLPENKNNEAYLMKLLAQGWDRKKSSLIVVVAEGALLKGVHHLAEKVQKKFPHFDIKVNVLGHMQRGGNPSCADRVLASRLGSSAVHSLIGGQKNVVVGWANAAITFTPFSKSTRSKQLMNKDLLDISQELSK
jgi:6-phosphofructokinase 1